MRALRASLIILFTQQSFDRLPHFWFLFYLLKRGIFTTIRRKPRALIQLSTIIDPPRCYGYKRVVTHTHTVLVNGIRTIHSWSSHFDATQYNLWKYYHIVLGIQVGKWLLRKKVLVNIYVYVEFGTVIEIQPVGLLDKRIYYVINSDNQHLIKFWFWRYGSNISS